MGQKDAYRAVTYLFCLAAAALLLSRRLQQERCIPVCCLPHSAYHCTWRKPAVGGSPWQPTAFSCFLQLGSSACKQEGSRPPPLPRTPEMHVLLYVSIALFGTGS